MIQETILTTQNINGEVHIAPMGIHILHDEFLVMPFKPSTTLNNLIATNCAVINYCDDVRIFAGCLTGRRNWPIQQAEKITGHYLVQSLAHTEIELVRIEQDSTRPKLFCKAVHSVNHAPFQGFNRAQFAVLELAILISRIDRLPWSKIQTELDYLRIGFDKTAGENEQQAWSWLMERIENYQTNGVSQ